MKKIYNEFFDETYYTEKLSNGLNVIIFHKPDFLSTACAFGTPFGALNTDQMVNGKEYHFNPGIAHFLEHKIFESEEKDIFATFSKMGCNVNAFTSYHETVYHFSTTSKDIKEPLNLLLDFVQNLDITDKTVEKEKGIIAQELSMYMQNADSRLVHEGYRSMYKNFPIKYDIGGDEASVYRITKDELEECYKINYHPSNMVLVITSPIDPEELIKIVKDNQDAKTFDEYLNPVNIPCDEPNEVFRKEYSFEMDISKPKHLYAIKLKPNFKDDRDIAFKVCALNIYLKAYFSPINPEYQNWIDQGIINDYFGYDIEFDKDYAYLSFYSEGDNFNLKELIDNTLKQDLCTEDIVRQLKHRYIGISFADFDDVESLTTSYIKEYLNGLDLFEDIEILMSVEKSNIVPVYKEFDYSNYAIVHILNKQSQ